MSLSTDEVSMLVSLHEQYYEHARHLEEMRSQHTNLFIFIAGGLLTALGVTGNDLLTDKGNRATLALAGTLVLLFGLLSLFRTFRWTAHILHDILRVERIHDLMARDRTSFGNLGLEKHQKRSGGFFPRFWRVERLFDQYVIALISSLGAAAISSAALLGRNLPSSIVGGLAVGGLIVAAVWEVAARKAAFEHGECCNF